VEPFYQRPVGFGQRAASGIQAQRYIASSGTSQQDLAELVARRWADAAANGGIAIDELPDAEAVLHADESAAPLTRLMMARPVDGAVAMLIAREDIARRVSRNPAFITGMGTSMDTHGYADRDGSRLASAEMAAAMAYRNAGWTTPEADLAEISASSVVGELMTIEALGLAGQGKGLSAVKEGKTVINKSGGALPADPIMATGLVRLAEASRQLSQSAPSGTAPRRAIVHGAGGVCMQNNCVFTLEV
jgi:acetyl-CoA C-acetyltransferase